MEEENSNNMDIKGKGKVDSLIVLERGEVSGNKDPKGNEIDDGSSSLNQLVPVDSCQQTVEGGCRRIYRCNYCPRLFSSFDLLGRHENNHTYMMGLNPRPSMIGLRRYNHLSIGNNTSMHFLRFRQQPMSSSHGYPNYPPTPTPTPTPTLIPGFSNSPRLTLGQFERPGLGFNFNHRQLSSYERPIRGAPFQGYNGNYHYTYRPNGFNPLEMMGRGGRMGGFRPLTIVNYHSATIRLINNGGIHHRYPATNVVQSIYQVTSVTHAENGNLTEEQERNVRTIDLLSRVGVSRGLENDESVGDDQDRSEEENDGTVDLLSRVGCHPSY